MSLKKKKRNHLKPVKACFAFLEIQAKVKDKTIEYSDMTVSGKCKYYEVCLFVFI